MRFLVDAQLPPALARWLESRGHQAKHVADLGLEAASDALIWQRAAQDGATIITKDEDFAGLRNTYSTPGPAVVWLRIGNTRKADLLFWMESILDKVVTTLESGEMLVEIDQRTDS